MRRKSRKKRSKKRNKKRRKKRTKKRRMMDMGRGKEEEANQERLYQERLDNLGVSTKKDLELTRMGVLSEAKLNEIKKKLTGITTHKQSKSKSRRKSKSRSKNNTRRRSKAIRKNNTTYRRAYHSM